MPVPRPRLGVAILTMGNRASEVAALLKAVARQDSPPQRIVVVGNGSPLPPMDETVTTVELDDNLGVSGGRNAAIDELRRFGDVDVVVDLDDDGLLIDSEVFSRIEELYEDDPGLGILSFRIADEEGVTQRRHVPRLRAPPIPCAAAR